MKKIEFSLIIPCYNEEKNIPLIIDRLKSRLNKKDFELILVDNGSKDHTQKAIKSFMNKHPSLKLVSVKKNIGYGWGIYSGLKKARGEFIGWTHADLQANPLDAFKALDILKKQDSERKVFVKGRRYGRKLFDKLFTWGMNIIETLVLRRILYDINAQPNVFRYDFMNLINEPPKEFSFDLYMYYIAKKKGYKIIRFPVYF